MNKHLKSFLVTAGTMMGAFTAIGLAYGTVWLIKYLIIIYNIPPLLVIIVVLTILSVMVSGAFTLYDIIMDTNKNAD